MSSGWNERSSCEAGSPEDLFSVLLNWLSESSVGSIDATLSKDTGVPSFREDEETPAIKKFSCLDEEKLLARVKHKTSTFRRLLQLAATEHREDAARLIDSAAREDFGAAEKIAHRIKGTAGQIEANTLHAKARRAEESWRRGQAVETAQLGALTTSLNDLLAEIDTYLAATSPS